MDLAQKNLQTLTQSNTSFLRIGCVSHAELERLPAVLSDIKAHFPTVLPRIFVHDYFTLKTLFENKQIDLMIVTHEMIQDMKNCFFTKITSMNSLALLPGDHPLAGSGPMTFDALAAFPLITLHPKVIPYQYGNRLQEKIRLYNQKHVHYDGRIGQRGCPSGQKRLRHCYPSGIFHYRMPFQDLPPFLLMKASPWNMALRPGKEHR